MNESFHLGDLHGHYANSHMTDIVWSHGMAMSSY